MMARGPVWLWPALAAVVGGIIAAFVAIDFPLMIGMLTMAPVISHVRHVGWRSAISEPSAITLIVGFYLLLFPLRGLVIAASGYTDLTISGARVYPRDLVSLLVLATISTTALVEGYYLTRRWRSATFPVLRGPTTQHPAVERLMFLLSAASILSLMYVLGRNGGVSGTRTLYITHSTTVAATAETGSGGSIWLLFTNPSAWCCAYVVFNVGSSLWIRFYALGVIAFIVAADLYIYGSRLNTTIALVGVWIIYHYSGRRTRALWATAAIVLGVVLSQPLLNGRQTASGAKGGGARLSEVERYSRTASYGVLDVSLRVHQHPQQLRAQTVNVTRYLAMPEYLVPSFLWHGRPNLATARIGYYTALDVDPLVGRSTGLPTTYITEGWLLLGWPGAILWSLAFGVLLGSVSRMLVGARVRPSPFAVLSYCFVVAFAWNYFKDGDFVASFVGDARAAIYLLFLCLLTGVLGERAPRRSDLLSPSRLFQQR